MFEKDCFPGGHRIRFSASLDLLDRAVAETVSLLTQRNALGSLFESKLLLREALLNAVIHGSGSDPCREVLLEATASEGRLTFWVQDQGPGFDWRECLANPPSPLDAHGRGLIILTLYADDVRFNVPGNRVTVTKTIVGLHGPACENDQDKANDPPRRGGAESAVRIEDGRTVFCPAGDIVASVAESLQTQLRELMHAYPGSLTLDLSRVELIDSVGIGLLLAVQNVLHAAGARLVLSHVNTDLAGLLRTMRLDKQFALLAD